MAFEELLWHSRRYVGPIILHKPQGLAQSGIKATMNSTVLFFLLIAIPSFVYSQPPDWKIKARELEEKYDKIKETCSEKMGVTFQEMRQSEGQAPKNQKEKCLLECIFSEAGLMNDGKYSRQGADVVAEFLFDDDELDFENLQLAREISRHCEKEVEKAKQEDKCETANEIFLCLRKVSKHRGFKENWDY